MTSPERRELLLGPGGPRTDEAVAVTIAGDRSALLPASATLLVADLHLGKAASFQKRGLAVPSGSDDETLSRLAEAWRRSRARELVILGDLFHDPRSLATEALQEVCRRLVSCLETAASTRRALHFIPGNHDRGAADAAAAAGMRLHPTEWEHPTGVLLRHHPPDSKPSEPRARPVIAGHVHPVARVAAPGERLRLPCFVFTPSVQGDQRDAAPKGTSVGTGEAPAVLTLPAFGSFTGGRDTPSSAGLSRVAVWEGALVELP